MVDELDLGSSVRKDVEVRVLSQARIQVSKSRSKKRPLAYRYAKGQIDFEALS